MTALLHTPCDAIHIVELLAENQIHLRQDHVLDRACDGAMPYTKQTQEIATTEALQTADASLLLICESKHVRCESKRVLAVPRHQLYTFTVSKLLAL